MYFILDKTYFPQFGYIMSIVFRVIALGVFSKCNLSLRYIGYKLPDGMEKYTALLNYMKFQVVDGHNKIMVIEDFLDKMHKIRRLLEKVLHRSQITRTHDLLTMEGDGKLNFLIIIPPWLDLNVFNLTFTSMYQKLNCTTQLDDILILSHQVLDECESIISFHHMLYDLMELQIILDIKRELLPYDGNSSRVRSDQVRVQPSGESSGYKFSDSFYKINSYLDVINGTFFQTSTVNNLTLSTSNFLFEYENKIRYINQTYAT